MDEADKAVDTYEMHLNGCLNNHRAAMRKVVEYEGAGECEVCEETYSRLVMRTFENEQIMVCARCRDKYKMG